MRVDDHNAVMQGRTPDSVATPEAGTYTLFVNSANGRYCQMDSSRRVIDLGQSPQQNSVGFDPGLTWNFYTDTESWTALNGTVAYDTANGRGILVTDTSSAGGTAIASPAGLSIDGNKYRRVKASITLVTLPAPVGSPILPRLLYATSGHGLGETERRITTFPTPLSSVGDTVVLDLDMENLPDGGTDWTTSTITQIRLHLTDVTPTGTVLRVNWISVGQNAPVEKVVGSGSPGGNTNEVQYNNAGSFGGAANVEIEGGNLGLTPVSSDPLASETNTLIYPLSIAGRVMPKWVSPGEPDNVVQASVHFNNVSTIGPGSGTTPSVSNCSLTNVGTVSHPVPSAGSLLSQTRRVRYITAATTAGTLCSLRVAVLEAWRGNAADQGGFFLIFRGHLDTLAAGNRGFFGLHSIVTAPTNIDPLADTTLTKLGFGFNTNTGNFFLIHGPNGVAPTTVNLGADFPINTTNVYEFILFCVPNSSSINYRCRNLTSGAAALNGDITTNMPATTTFLARTAWMCNNTTAANVSFQFQKFNLETDF